MSSLIFKFVIGGGVLAMLYRVYLQVKGEFQTIKEHQANNRVQGDLNEIKKAGENVKETDRDYNSTVDEFRRNNPPG